MGKKISEKIKKHVISWDEDRGDLLLKEYQESTFNPNTNEYDIVLVSINKVGGADYGNMFDYTGGSITTIVSTGIDYLVNCTTISNFRKGFLHTNGRLTKINDAYGPIKLEGIIAFNGSNNDEIHVFFYKNGIQIPCSKGTMVIRGSGGNTISFHCMTDMIDGDYIEVYASNQTRARDITLENMNIILTELT